MKVLTIATEKRGYFNALEESCRRHGYDLVVLGLGQEWKGFSMRLKLMLNQLSTMDENETIIVADAFDVVFLQSSHKLKEKLKQYPEDKILFGKDDYYPFLRYIWGTPTFKEPSKCYINAGVYIGKVGIIRQLLSNICINKKCEKDLDDQHLLNMYHKQLGDPSIMVDHDTEIIYNFDTKNNQFLKTLFNRFFLGKRTCIEQHHVKKTENNTAVFHDTIEPFILHANGFTDMDYLCGLLGLPKEDKREFNTYNGWKTILHFTKRKFYYMVHCIVAILSGLLPFISIVWNIKFPLWVWFIYIVIMHLLVLHWFIFKKGILHDYENLYNFEETKVFMNVPFISDNILFYVTTFLPLVNTLLTIWIIYSRFILPCRGKRRRL